MKRAIVFILVFSFFTLATKAQDCQSDVVFSKFKLEWFNVMGMRGGSDGQRLKMTFKNTSDKALKYIKVYYWAVNAVNDITTDRFGRNKFSVRCTGPFKPNKTQKREVDIVLFHPNLLEAYPYKLEITDMDGEENEIEISKGNLNDVFPNIEYINIGNME